MVSGDMTQGAGGSTSQPALFLGHVYPDRRIVQMIADGLAVHGIEVIVEEATMFLGDSLLERVSATIGDRGYVAVALSPRSVHAEWVQEEARSLAAREHRDGIVILPLLVADCEIPDFLEDRFFADFRRPEAYQESLDLIIRRLGLPDEFRALKDLGLAWYGPLRLEGSQILTLSFLFFDGSDVVKESRLHAPDDVRIAKLPVGAMAQTASVDLKNRRLGFVHVESRSQLRPQRTLRSEGVASGDHVVVVVGAGATIDAEAIVRRVASAVREHER